jgi:hypothetical protein
MKHTFVPAMTTVVIPAQAGIQCVRSRGLSQSEALDPRLRGDDEEAEQ